MAIKKRRYTISINGGAPKRCYRYTFDYSNAKGNRTYLGPRGATVEMSIGPRFDAVMISSMAEMHGMRYALQS